MVVKKKIIGKPAKVSQGIKYTNKKSLTVDKHVISQPARPLVSSMNRQAIVRGTIVKVINQGGGTGLDCTTVMACAGIVSIANRVTALEGAGYITCANLATTCLETIQDIVGAMASGGTQAGITVTYNDVGGFINFSVPGATPLTVQDEGVNVDTATTLINFIGAGVTATTGGAGIVNVTIPGGGGQNIITIQDEGIAQCVNPTAVNFVGAGVTASCAAGVATITISGSTPLIVEDEGVPLATQGTMNFVGAGVTVTTGGGKYIVTIPAATGITSLNAQVGAAQTFSTATTGTDFAIVSAANNHEFRLPVASAVNTGKISSADWSTFNAKMSDPMTTIGDIIIRNAVNVTARLGIGTVGQVLTTVAGVPARASLPVVANTAHIEHFVATAAQIVFTLAFTPASNEFVRVSMSTGAYGKQDPIYDYTVSGNIVTLNNPASVGDVISVQYIESLSSISTNFDNEFVAMKKSASSQSFTVSGVTQITFSTAIGKTSNFNNATDELIVPVGGAGTYKIGFNIKTESISLANNGDMILQVYKNGLPLNMSYPVSLDSTAYYGVGFTISFTDAVDLVDGDAISLYMDLSVVGLTNITVANSIQNDMRFERVR